MDSKEEESTEVEGRGLELVISLLALGAEELAAQENDADDTNSQHNATDEGGSVEALSLVALFSWARGAVGGGEWRGEASLCGAWVGGGVRDFSGRRCCKKNMEKAG